MNAIHIRALAFVVMLWQLPLVLKPVDEASREPALVTVRTEAIAALQARSPARFTAVVAEDLSLGAFGHGKDELRRILDSYVAPNVDHAAPTLLDEIVAALSLGGAFTSIYGERQFCAPYVYGAYPSSYPLPNDTDYPILVILRPNVEVKAAADPASRTIGRLSYRLVRVGDAGGEHYSRDGSTWYRIEFATRNGIYGFVEADAVRSPEDYHVCFAKRDGRWQIVTIANDEFPHQG